VNSSLMSPREVFKGAILSRGTGIMLLHNHPSGDPEKWRLVQGKELYDVSSDPGLKQNVAADHTDVVRKMRDHYARWWSDVGPRASEFCDLIIGSDAEPVTPLRAQAWFYDANGNELCVACYVYVRRK
jgi:hypothetical protein